MAPRKTKKSSKARGIGVDFKKVKNKVGRRLAPASNVTKVDIKSKSIILVGQSVAADKKGLAVNNRRLTLKELFQQTTHHNDNVRKDALMGIKDLLSRHPEELRSSAVSLVGKLCPRINDNSKAVRQALLELFQETIFAGLPQVLMCPLIPIMMAYISSAMTNLVTDIRIYSFQFLDALIQSYPSLVAANYVTQIIQSVVDFLSKPGIASQAGGQLRNILNTLLRFLSAYEKKSGFLNLSRTTCTENEQKVPRIFLSALHSYKSTVAEMTSILSPSHKNSNNGEGPDEFPMDLAEALVKALSSCWSECATLVCCGQLPDKDNLECMIKICSAIRFLVLIIKPELEQQLQLDSDITESKLGTDNPKLFRAGKSSHQSWIKEHLLPFLHRQLIAPFPIQAPLINLPKEMGEPLLLLNLSVFEAAMYIIIAGSSIYVEQYAISKLLNYFVDILNGQMLSFLGLSVGNFDKASEAAYLRRVLPFLPWLLLHIDREYQLRILTAFTNLFKSCKPTSKLKHLCLACIVKILQQSNRVEEQACHGTFMVDIFSFQKQWLQMLPMLLWELKENHCSTSLAVLKVLHYLGHTAPQCSLLAQEYMSLQPTLIPFFSTSYPSKSKNAARRLYGPFLKLPFICQEMALDLLFYYDKFSTAFLRAIAYCLCTELQVDLVVRCLEVIQAVYRRGSIQLSDYLSFIFTVLLESASTEGRSKEENYKHDSRMDTAKSYKRQRIIVGALCSCLLQIGDQRLVLHLLSPLICSSVAASPPPIVSFGLIQIINVLGTFETGLCVPKSLFDSLPSFLRDYVLLLAKRCFQHRINQEEFSISPFLHPFLNILAKSLKLSEAVLRQVCMLTNSGGKGNLYGRIFALVQIVSTTSARSKVVKNLDDASLFHSFEGGRALDIFQLEEANASSLFQTLTKIINSAYGWDMNDKCKMMFVAKK
ncbi:hypothetical protein KP509_34G050100 [Ceratopteris richardii]|uniref:Pre-rRNA-processing protein Ipi1 N-terminal domain-containing protein n=1 Tax=Ceratopteris richardii TaxID=49495 RepID=A0A8T2QLG7_CERRI|nr:hypothetical protein KP509_34G050100 [Ceratopteris richardii]